MKLNKRNIKKPGDAGKESKKKAAPGFSLFKWLTGLSIWEWLRLKNLKKLLNGGGITRKGYNFSEHRRDDKPDEIILPKDVLILEGIHCFYDKRLTEMMFLKLYMQVEPDICLLRRIERDIVERGREKALNSTSLATRRARTRRATACASAGDRNTATDGSLSPKSA